MHGHVAGDTVGEDPDQRGLADTGITGDQDQTPATRLHRCRHARVQRLELAAAFDQRVQSGAEPGVRGVVPVTHVQRHQGVAQSERIRTWRDLQLLREHPLHRGKCTQPGSPVATVQGGPQQPQVCGLAHGVEPQQRLPQLRCGQQRDHQRLMTSAVLLDPFVQLVGQEDERLVPDQVRAFTRVGRELAERSAGGRLELDGVDLERVSSGQGDDVVAQLEDPFGGAERLAREVSCLVETWQRLLRREIRPQRVDNALAVQSGTRGEGEELDQLGGLASVPGRPHRRARRPDERRTRRGAARRRPPDHASEPLPG